VEIEAARYTRSGQRTKMQERHEDHRSIFKEMVAKGWGMAQVVEGLPSKHKSIRPQIQTPALPKKKQKKKDIMAKNVI
jgi:hypothetical protein